MNNISKRLKSIADLVDNNSRIVDIGCDHGLLDVYLAKYKKNITIIASDINEKALNNAKNNISKYKLDNIIETRLGNGLNVVNSEEIDTVIMSGLGTHTIVGILVNNLNKLKNVDTIIIQSNTNIEFLRKKVIGIGYYIKEELLIEDKGIIYTVIKFKKGRKRYKKREIFFGPILLKENSRLFQKKNKQDLEKLKYLMTCIPKNHFHHRFITYLKIRMYK